LGEERELGLGESGMGWDSVQKPIQGWLALLRAVVNAYNFTCSGCLEVVTAV